MRVRVEEARSCMQSARSQSKVLDSLLQLKRSGRIPGIHGRLVCWLFVLFGCLTSDWSAFRTLVYMLQSYHADSWICLPSRSSYPIARNLSGYVWGVAISNQRRHKVLSERKSYGTRCFQVLHQCHLVLAWYNPSAHIVSYTMCAKSAKTGSSVL